MAAVAVAGHTTEHGPGAKGGPMAAVAGRDLGVHSYYQGKIDEMELVVRDRTQNLERLKAQRNELNAKVRLLREELHHLQESGSYVGEVVKAMGKKKVLVKVNPEGKYVVDIDKDIDVNKCTPNTRVALRNDSYVLHKILPTKVDPLVSLMKVEKVPDSTYDMIGGLEKQIREIKGRCEVLRVFAPLLASARGSRRESASPAFASVPLPCTDGPLAPRPACSTPASCVSEPPCVCAPPNMEKPFVEKYRPRRIDDIVGNAATASRLKTIAQEGNMPNMILTGPPGIGKTTSIHCLAHELLGKAYDKAVLELNASDERGIDVVRNKIKVFAQKQVTLPPGRHKIIILDEADSMTKGAQQGLRRTMELASSTTRFALACNLENKLLDAIHSRCAVLRYTRLADVQIAKRVQEVATMEGITMTDKGLEAIVFTAEGDMRNALNALQATTAGFGLVNDTNVFKVCDQPHPVAVQKMVAACIAGDIDTACATMNEVHGDGFAVTDVIGTLFKVIKTHPMGEDLKLAYMKELAALHLRVAAGLTSKLQLDGLLAKLVFLRRKFPKAAEAATKAAAAAATAAAAAAASSSSSGGGGGGGGAPAAGAGPGSE